MQLTLSILNHRTGVKVFRLYITFSINNYLIFCSCQVYDSDLNTLMSLTDPSM